MRIDRLSTLAGAEAVGYSDAHVDGSLAKRAVAPPCVAYSAVLNRVEWRLFDGNNRKPMITVVPDGQWAGMWRIVRPDGSLSDMANLARAKDAAVLICQFGPPSRDRRRFHWKKREDAA